MSRKNTPAGPLLLAGLSLVSAGAPAAPATQTHSFTLEAPCEQVFSLFTAEGERAWAPGWEPEILSGSVERGSVFRTRSGGRETVWVVTQYSPAQGRVSYARIAQGSNMGLVDVRCRGAGPKASEISVTYTLTGITAEGRAFVEQFFAGEAYGAFIQEWRDAIMTHLNAGQAAAR
jgi:hypothetical protein